MKKVWRLSIIVTNLLILGAALISFQNIPKTIYTFTGIINQVGYWISYYANLALYAVFIVQSLRFLRGNTNNVLFPIVWSIIVWSYLGFFSLIPLAGYWILYISNK